MSRATLALLLTVLFMASSAAAQDKPAKPDTPLDLAQKALDHFRDDVHKKEIKIVWPKAEANVPDDAEVCLISGYIDYTRTCFTWKKGVARAESVEMDRTWFYNPGGESFTSRRVTIKPEDFARVWQAVQLLKGAATERIKPPPPDPEGTVHGGFSSSFSSHESTLWVRMKTGKNVLYLRALSGSHSSDGIQDWEELVHRAIFRVWNELMPDVRRDLRNMGILHDPVEDVQANETDPATLELLKSWAPALVEEVKSASSRPAEDGNRLLLETSLRMLGEAGYKPAATVIASLLKKPTGDYWTERVREEAGYAQTKIRFANHWDSATAAAEIRANPHKLHAQSDMERWLRARFHRQDAEGYRRMLLADLVSPVDNPRLKRMTIVELQRNYAGQGLKEMLPLIRSNPSVALDAARAILGTRPDNKEAITAVERIAGDPATPIAPEQEWYESFARSRALKYLISDKAPAACRWTPERIRRQLEVAGEDGRMVIRLFQALTLLKTPVEPGAEVLVWRRVLKGSINKGVLVACENLIRMQDKESAKDMERVLAELLAGAKYPWLIRSSVEALQADLAKMTTATAL